ncbi:MAG: dipeptidase PepE [Bacteroidales bacterium]|nr:dipeptidase PepE [Bacteroidales bacterium]
MRLLLFSNSTNAGEEYLAYTLPYIKDFLGNGNHKAVFIPYAGISLGYDAYFNLVYEKLIQINIELLSMHSVRDKKKAINNSEVLITGGGNTFCLLKSLQENKLLDLIRKKVKSGTPYIGWSAGANLACPTIKTTNDMPIAEPAGFNALNLVPFQINPHFSDYVQEGFAGESRETRIEEFLLLHQNKYVAGLREGTLIKVDDNEVELLGNKPCRIFRYGYKPYEVNPFDNLFFLMQEFE